MSHSEICPVCKGSGKVRNDLSQTAPMEKVCYGCGGWGWVTIQETYPICPEQYPWWWKSPYHITYTIDTTGVGKEVDGLEQFS